MRATNPSRQTDYGQDAPGVRLGMFLIATVGLAISISAWLIPSYWKSRPAGIVSAFEALGILGILYGAGMGTYMTWASKTGKLRTRDDLLTRAGKLRPWRGDDVVVDVGCGRGLMLIGATKQLDRGTAIGIDLWREEDQSNNSPEAALENARREGVQDRVRIKTGDARKLPLEDASVDVVLSHWVVHNLESEADRTRALDEMWRVLRPRGVLVLADIAHVPGYLIHLTALGAQDCSLLDGGWEARIMGALSGGSYKPQALICSRPA